ncbi:MAG: T9SS type A sorting domain-containing protein [Chitinophagaceae bacterium]|nr:T9SS type A sorting domain-containing protein [Chitinophagaceae bacterium]
MNKLYPLATLLATLLLIHGAAQAQTGGTYTAVRSGFWHTPSGVNPWDPNGEPPSNCINCRIVINSGVTVKLNTHVVLSGGSTLVIGSDGSNAAVLQLQLSTGLQWNDSYNIILPNDGSNPTNSLNLHDNLAFVNASSSGRHDGVLTSFTSGTTSMYFKKFGNSPDGFSDTTAVSFSPAAYGNGTVAGPATLTATGTLPIVLTDFDAVVNNGAVNLTWTTQFEQNSDHFDVERSSNGGAKWDVIGKVAARGYSALPVNYSFTDANPGGGTLQYRVHGYDVDGRPTLSPIKVIRTTPLASVTIFPNPAKDYVNVSLPVGEAGLVSIRLFGQSGQLLAEKRVQGAGGTIQSFPVSSYAPGNYLVQVVTADGAKQVSKIVISRQ